MSYLKLFKVVQDTPVGYQSINQAAENLEAHRTAWKEEHGSIGLPPGGTKIIGASNPFLVPGKHDDTRIIRAVANVSLTLDSNGNLIVTLTAPADIIPSVTRTAEGTYYFEIKWLQRFWAKATPLVDSGSSVFPLFTNERPTLDANGNHGLYVYVYERESGSGAFELGDVSFNLHVWGRTS